MGTNSNEEVCSPRRRKQMETNVMTVSGAAAILRDDPQGADKLNAMIGAEISILGSKFHIGVVKKGEGGYTVLLIPKKGELEEGGKTLQDMIDAIKNMTGKEVNTEELKEIVQDPEHPNRSFDSVKAEVTMAFLYIDRDKEGQGVTEYAFQLKVTGLDDIIPESVKTFASIEEFEVSVWNTKREKVLKEMDLKKPEEYLKDEEE